jgi:hypothetical protein
MQEVISDVRKAGQSSLPLEGTPMTMTRCWDYNNRGAQAAQDRHFLGSIVQSIESERDRLSSIATDDLDTMSEELGYRVAKAQKTAIENLQNYKPGARRFGSVTSVPDDHRFQEVNVIKDTEFRSLEDVNS